MSFFGKVVDWAQVALIALRLVSDLVDWVEREQIRDEFEREAFRKRVEKYNAYTAEARTIRARTRAELAAASPDELRQHRDAHFRD